MRIRSAQLVGGSIWRIKIEIATIYLYIDGQIKLKVDGKNIRFVLETKPEITQVLEASRSHIEKNVTNGYPTGKDLIVY